jgi:HAD superfamily hydrolase (TIGR01509 family)
MAGRLQAVLFDMDGTLVDTEPYWIEAEYRLVAEFGGTWTDEDAHAVVGNALIATAERLRDVGGVRLEPPVIVERLLDDVIAAVERVMPWRPGAVDLLTALRAAGAPCAMVTMSYARLAATLVAKLPNGTFGAVVTGDQVQDGKPHPEAYLTAAQRLAVDPSKCVAIEDSPTGVASARAAGCPVLAVPHHVPIEAAPGVTFAKSLTGLSVADLAALVPG